MKRNNRIAVAAFTVPAAALALMGVVKAPGEPEVNNPPEIEEFTISFGVKAGHLIGIDTAKAEACTRVQVVFSVKVKDHEGDQVTVTMDLDGDGKLDDAKKVVKAEGTAVAKKTFNSLGKVDLRYKACDKPGLCSAVVKQSFDVVSCPPQFHIVNTDVEHGDFDKKGLLELTSRDVQEDKVWYEIDWDDDRVFETKTKPGPPDEEVALEHTWNDQLMHIISLRVCDGLDGCSAEENRKF